MCFGTLFFKKENGQYFELKDHARFLPDVSPYYSCSYRSRTGMPYKVFLQGTISFHVLTLNFASLCTELDYNKIPT